MSISERLSTIRERIQRTAENAGRDPAAIILLAVSKGQPVEAIREAADCGLTLFGESKIQEARLKIGQLPPHLRWQMIGHLQSNKARDAVHFFEMIQSMDSLPLAEEVNRLAHRAAKTMPVLLEVNVAGEATKYGFKPSDLPAALMQINALPRLEIHGLMTIAPWTSDPERARPWFRQLRDLKRMCEDRLGAPLPHLSMGMSGDLEVAIEEGATMVRVGTALFGPRRGPGTTARKTV